MLQTRMLAPGGALIEAIAREAMTGLSPAVRDRLGSTTVEVAELADEALLDARDIMDPFELTGPHAGLPPGAAIELPLPPGTLRLFRRAIIDRWVEEGSSLDRVVADAVRHEVRHLIDRAAPPRLVEDQPVRRAATG